MLALEAGHDRRFGNVEGRQLLAEHVVEDRGNIRLSLFERGQGNETQSREEVVCHGVHGRRRVGCHDEPNVGEALRRIADTGVLSVFDDAKQASLYPSGQVVDFIEKQHAAFGALDEGQGCANPVLSTINYFRDEYEAHIKEHRCPAASCDAMVISACQHACPAGIDVPNYVAAIADGDYDKAVEIIRERNPFPAVCGRICVHPCEMKCRRGELDDPVAIRSLKRFASDRHYERFQGRTEPFPLTREVKVAVVGAGPSGLTCAYFLRQMGYPVTVFEAKDRAGGMTAITIPEFRLPREIIEQDIAYIVSAGVDIRYNSPIDRNHTVQDLLREGFSAVFIAAGAQAAKSVGIPGEEDKPAGLMYGLEFLSRAKADPEIKVGHRVLVIGGGNVAMDVARTARRLGGGQVRAVCLEKRSEMPAWQKDIEEAEEEGVSIENSWGPKQVIIRDGRAIGVEFIRCTSVFDMEGRFRPVYDEEESVTFHCDTLIVAIGQAPDLSFLSEDEGLERAMWGTLQVDENTLATNIPGIFAGGDFTAGPHLHHPGHRVGPAGRPGH